MAARDKGDEGGAEKKGDTLPPWALALLIVASAFAAIFFLFIVSRVLAVAIVTASLDSGGWSIKPRRKSSSNGYPIIPSDLKIDPISNQPSYAGIGETAVTLNINCGDSDINMYNKISEAYLGKHGPDKKLIAEPIEDHEWKFIVRLQKLCKDRLSPLICINK